MCAPNMLNVVDRCPTCNSMLPPAAVDLHREPDGRTIVRGWCRQCESGRKVELDASGRCISAAPIVHMEAEDIIVRIDEVCGDNIAV